MSLKETSYLSQELHDKMCLKIADLIRVIDKLFREYYQKNVRYASLKNQHEQQCALNKRLEADNQALNEANAKLSEEILTLKSSIARSNSKLDELANTHTQLLTGASNEIESLKLELSEIKSLRESESKRLQVCQKCIEFGREVKQLQLLLEDQSDKLIQLDKSKNNFLREKKELNSQIQLTNDEKRVLNDKLMAVQSKLTQCISENESLKSNLYDLQAKIKLSKSPKKLSDSSIKRQYWLQSTPVRSKCHIVMWFVVSAN
jgi:chromosome segregation ATPase